MTSQIIVSTWSSNFNLGNIRVRVGDCVELAFSMSFYGKPGGLGGVVFFSVLMKFVEPK